MIFSTRFQRIPPEPCTKSHADRMNTFEITRKRDLKLMAVFCFSLFLVAEAPGFGCDVTTYARAALVIILRENKLFPYRVNKHRTSQYSSHY